MTHPDKPTKIVMALYYYHPYVSGLTVYAKWVAEGLAARGYGVTVLTSRHDKSLPKQEMLNGVRVVRRPVMFRLGKGVIMPTFWLDIIRYARTRDYVNVQLPMAEIGFAALFVPKKKLISTYHCDLYLGSKLIDRIITAFSLASMKVQLWRSRTVVSNTKDYFEHSQMKNYIDKLVPIYPPVPLAKPAKNVTQFFEKIGVADDEVKIGFVGRVVYEKGIEYLLQAIPIIKQQIPRFKILLLGDYSKVAGGSVKDQLDKYLADYPEHVIFTGYLDDEDRDRFYAGLDVFVLPSVDPLESFGIVQVEAMIQGAPVVASNLPGVREPVSKTGYGLIAEPKNPNSIAKQIVAVVKNRTQYVPDVEHVKALFNPDESIQAYARLFVD